MSARTAQQMKEDVMGTEPQQLQMFEGLTPDLSEVKLSGAAPGRDVSYRIGQVVYVLVQAEVVGVTHEKRGKPEDRVLVRSHKLATEDAVVLDAKVGREMLADLLNPEGEVAGLAAV